MMRFIFICSALLVVSAGAALGADNYQRTKDGKVTVWNDDPKPGDTAQWFGDRDKENYATGLGTLIWYTGDGALYARYHGNMVHGKFDGAVNVHSKGKTAHAIFVDGKRTGRWAAGPAPSQAEPDWRSGANARLITKPSAKKTPRIEPATITAQAPQGESSTSVTQPKPDKALSKKSIVAKKEPAENPVEKQDIPAEGPSVEKKSVMANPSIDGLENTTTSSVGKDRSATSNAESVRESGIQNSTKTSGNDTNKLKPEIDDLLAPPPTLRTDPIVETSSTAEPQTATSLGANAQLTREEAVNLADTEARTQGYDLNQYQR